MSQVEEGSSKKPIEEVPYHINHPFDPGWQGLGERDKLKTLEEDRKKIYGDPYLSHQAIGLAWEGVFRNRYHALAKFINEEDIRTLFPADLVAEMLAAFKIVRLARPVYLKDSGDDAQVYTKFSMRFRGGKDE